MPTPHPDGCYLALDQGGHSSRAIVFDHHGQMLASARVAVATHTEGEDRVEQDPIEIVDSLRTACGQAMEQAGEPVVRRLVSAGLATQRSSLVCWDRESGAPLSPVISWQDRRADDWLQQFAPRREAIHMMTGLFLSAHYGASKLRWCLEHLHEVKQAHHEGRLVFGPLASYLVYSLLEGKPLMCDPANASRTQLWNINTRQWDSELLLQFGIPESALPWCVPSLHEFGNLSVGGVTLPMTVVNGDQSAAMYAFGRLQPDTAYLNIGTGAFLSRPSGHYPLYGRRLLSSIIFDDGNKQDYVLEGTVNGAASALDWVQAELGLGDFLDRLPEWLEQEQELPLFLNGVSGLGAPFWVSNFRSGFVGNGTDEARVVAVVESIVFLIQANLDEMHKLSSPPQQIQLTGGMATLDGLCQRIADLSGLPVYRPVDCEATARGTAYLLAGQPAAWPEEDIGQWFKPKANEALKARYERWNEAMLTRMRGGHRAVD